MRGSSSTFLLRRFLGILVLGSAMLAVDWLPAWAQGDGSAGSVNYYQQELGQFAVGSGSVGPSGSVFYSYPMGTASASYSSQGGWSVGGTSAVTRSTKWGVPQYTDADIFLLDGSELVCETNCASSGPGITRIYHTQQESYARIQYHDVGTTSSWWSVTQKDGSIKLFGNTTDSRIERVGLPQDLQPRAWFLASVTDAGNFGVTRYVYTEDPQYGGAYLDRIISGKTGAGTCGYTATILFYVADPTPKTSFHQGTKVQINRVPKSVGNFVGTDVNGNLSCAGQGGVLSAFKITWMESPTTKTPVITSITPYGSDVQADGPGDPDPSSPGDITGGSSLPPTTFEYGTVATQFAASYATWDIPGETSYAQSAPLRSEREAGTSQPGIAYAGIFDMWIWMGMGFLIGCTRRQQDKSFGGETPEAGLLPLRYGLYQEKHHFPKQKVFRIVSSTRPAKL